MSQYQLHTVEQAPELEAQHLDGLTLDKQVIKDLEPNDDRQVQGGARIVDSTVSTAPHLTQ